VTHQVDGPGRVLVPEVDHEDEEGAIDIVGVNLVACGSVAHDQPNARRRRDGPSILVAKPAHSGSDRLLLDPQPVDPIVSLADEVVCFIALPVGYAPLGSWQLIWCALRRRRLLLLLLL
jgi:hypothetical protein